MQRIFFFLGICLVGLVFLGFGKKNKPTYFHEVSHYSFGSTENQTFKMRYLSDKLEIEGFLVRPREIDANEKLPLIIYNRGGNRDFGAIEFKQLKFMNKLASQGYVVMASQYRGNMNSEGQDEFGGEDVNDIIQLTNLAERMKYIDTDNMGTIGVSRGGLMSLLLSKKTDVFKTHICIGAPSNLFESISSRPMMYSKVYTQLIGDTLSNKTAYVNRSAVFWADEINDPLLILHGEEDVSVGVSQAQTLSDSLTKYNKTHKIHIIKNGNHALTSHTSERDSVIIDWFDAHLKK